MALPSHIWSILSPIRCHQFTRTKLSSVPSISPAVPISGWMMPLCRSVIVRLLPSGENVNFAKLMATKWLPAVKPARSHSLLWLLALSSLNTFDKWHWILAQKVCCHRRRREERREEERRRGRGAHGGKCQAGRWSGQGRHWWRRQGWRRRQRDIDSSRHPLGFFSNRLSLE